MGLGFGVQGLGPLGFRVQGLGLKATDTSLGSSERSFKTVAAEALQVGSWNVMLCGMLPYSVEA